MLVVDSNIAFKLIVREHDSDRAEALAASAGRNREKMVGPPLLRYEITNIIVKHLRRDLLPAATGAPLWAAFERLPIGILPLDLSQRALEIALRYNLPAAYDAHYLALADRLGCDFWTADQRLINLLGGALSGVRWLGSVAVA